jgi:hypothetical protein
VGAVQLPHMTGQHFPGDRTPGMHNWTGDEAGPGPGDSATETQVNRATSPTAPAGATGSVRSWSGRALEVVKGDMRAW